ncbi:MAG: AAA family ATPase [Desulfobacterales bacterium]|jgi:hypothetical protein
MIRFASKELDKWLKNPNRKPMVIRGARQVGKTWLVRDLAIRHELKLVELNFERLPGLADLFSENDPTEILRNIEAEFGTSLELNSSLIFLDEIQAAPQLFSKLRWFREDLPQLPVIAAGSLLDFALSEYQYSMPVGRITYFYLEPMSFFEFLNATGNQSLRTKLSAISPETKLPESLHEKCLGLYHDYYLVGGMPEVVQEWIDCKNWQATGRRQGEIDYITQHGNRVVPVEVKSGATGSMKSLHQFMAEKQLDFAVRCNLNQPLLESISVKTTLGQSVSYRLLSIPLYLTERLDGLIEHSLKNFTTQTPST